MRLCDPGHKTLVSVSLAKIQCGCIFVASDSPLMLFSIPVYVPEPQFVMMRIEATARKFHE
jgi:hypothetical protein